MHITHTPRLPSTWPSLSRMRAGFTMVEILIVVIIVGLLSGLAIYKLGESKELADINYMKATITMLEKGVQRVVLAENTFPTIPDGTPDQRIAFVLSQLESKNMIVYLEQTYGEEWTAAKINYINPLKERLALADTSTGDSIVGSLSKMRGVVPSGQPEAKEILVLPAGLIVYPESPSFVINDPSNPNYAFYYQTYWLPREVARGVQNLLNGGFASDAERALVMANLGMVDLDEAAFKGLLLSTTDSAEHQLAANQLADIIRGNITSNMTPAEAQRLLDQMLNHPNYDPSTLDITGLDLSGFSDYSLNRLASNNFLDGTQVDYLLAKVASSTVALDKQQLIVTLLGNSGLDATSAGKTATVAGTLSATRSGQAAIYWNAISANAGLTEAEKTAQLSTYFDSASTTMAALPKGPSSSATLPNGTMYASLITLAKDSPVWTEMSQADKELVSAKVYAFIPLPIGTIGVAAAQNAAIGELYRSGTLPVTNAMVTLAISSLTLAPTTSTINSLVLAAAKGSALQESQKSQIRSLYSTTAGANASRLTYSPEILANAEIFTTEASLSAAITYAYNNGSNANVKTALYALQNPNMSTAQANTLADSLLASNGLRSGLTAQLATAGDLLAAKISPEKQAALVEAAVTRVGESAYGSLAQVVGKMTNLTEAQHTSVFNAVVASPGSTLATHVVANTPLSVAELQTLAATANSTLSSNLFNSVFNNATGTRTTQLDSAQKTALLATMVASNPAGLVARSNLADNSMYSQEAILAIGDAVVNKIETSGAASLTVAVGPALFNALPQGQKDKLELAFVDSGFSTMYRGSAERMSDETYSLYVDTIAERVANGTITSGNFSTYPVKKTPTETQAQTLLASLTTGAANQALNALVLPTIAQTESFYSNASALVLAVGANSLTTSTNAQNAGKVLASAIVPNAPVRPEILDAFQANLAQTDSTRVATVLGGFAPNTKEKLQVLVEMVKRSSLTKTQVATYFTKSTPGFDDLSLDEKNWINANILH